MPVAEILTPDGDGDEERGIQQLENFANLRPRGTVLFADPHYVEYKPGGGDAETERRRKDQADRRNAASPTLHYMSGIATSAAGSLGSRRQPARRPAGFGHQQSRVPPILPGGGFAPHETAERPTAQTELPQEMNIAEAARATGHLIVSHSSQPPEPQSGPELYLG